MFRAKLMGHCVCHSHCLYMLKSSNILAYYIKYRTNLKRKTKYECDILAYKSHLTLITTKAQKSTHTHSRLEIQNTSFKIRDSRFEIETEYLN